MEGGYGDEEKELQPPPSGLAAIASAVAAFRDDAEMTIVPSQMIEPSGQVRYREMPEMAAACGDADHLGVSCRWDNQEAAIALAHEVQKTNRDVRIVFGGPNMWSEPMAEMVLRNVPPVHAVIRQAGEGAFPAYLAGAPLESIPNLSYRKDGTPLSNDTDPPDMNTLPLWDFRHVQDPRHIAHFDSRDPQYHAPRDLDLAPCVESNRGCSKASRTKPCSFCTSGRAKFQLLGADRFFDQLAHLYEQHGMKDFWG
jgi:hypothetical protein